MTIEELLDCDVAALEQMTDDDLAKHFAPYLVVCNPPEHEPNVVNIGKPKRKKAAKKKVKKAAPKRAKKAAKKAAALSREFLLDIIILTLLPASII